MLTRLVKGVMLLAFTPIYLLTMLILLLSPIMTFTDIVAVHQHGAPKTNMLTFLFFISFILYLSMRIQSFRRIYQKIPVLWPLSQILFIGTTGLSFGLFFMNLWAENEVISKTVAIILTIISFLLARVFMSYWYRKYPISVKMFK